MLIAAQVYTQVDECVLCHFLKNLYVVNGMIIRQTLYINNKLVFDHSCDTLKLTPEVIWDKPFLFETGAGITLGKPNTLAVRVYNRRGMGGIWKPVYIVASNAQLDQADIESAVGKEP